MNSQVYIATAGLLVEQRRLELVSQNLANVSSAAYHAQHLFTMSYSAARGAEDDTLAAANTSVAIAGSYERPERGPLESTGRNLDVALAEDLYFEVDTPAGQRYTRAGNLEILEGGRLATAGGFALLSEGGQPIEGLSDPVISADGGVLDRGSEVASLAVVRDPKRVLRREGDGLFTAAGREAALEKVDEPALDPGWLESSGVDPLTELIRMIESQRAFESYQKLITLTMNDVNRRAVNDLAG